MTRAREIRETLAFQLLLLPAVLLLLATVTFVAGHPIAAWHFPLAVALAIALSRLVPPDLPCGTERASSGSGVFASATGAFLALLLLCSLAARAVHDFSFDGMMYHGPAVLALAEGWNPIHQPFVELHDPRYGEPVSELSTWIDHYPKGSWIAAAALCRFSGSVEAGKAFNLLLQLAAFLVAWNFLSRFERIPPASALLLGALVAANPVCATQAFTYYNDTQVASLLAVEVVSIAAWALFRERRAVWFVGLAVLLMVNMKFSGLVYGSGLLLLSWVVGRLAGRGPRLRPVAIGVAALSIAALLVGFQPYVTNLVAKKNPFYPAIEISTRADRLFDTAEDGQAPDEFMNRNRFSKLFLSIFSGSDNADFRSPEWKLSPFPVRERELVAFEAADTRYGGFGPFFGQILLPVVVAGALLAAGSTAVQGGMVAAGVILSVALLNPEAWWARLSPQVWLLPMTILVSFFGDPRPWAKRLRRFFLAALAANAIVVATRSVGHSVALEAGFRTRAAEISKAARAGGVAVVYSEQFDLMLEHRIRELGIETRRTLVRPDREHPPREMLKMPGVAVWIEAESAGGRPAPAP